MSVAMSVTYEGNLRCRAVHELIHRLRAIIDEYDDRLCIGEVWGPLVRWVKYFGQRGEGLHLPFNFRLIERPWTAYSVRQTVNEIEVVVESFAWPNFVLGNHDVPRLASRVGPRQARVAAMALLTLRGTPTLYYGDELGLENGVIPLDRLQDPQGLQLGVERTRDVARTPMPWDDGPFAGFSTREPWLPLNPDCARRNVAAMSADPRSILTLYRRLLALRRATPALQEGRYLPIEAGDEQIFTYLRQHAAQRLLVALNFGAKPSRLTLPGHVAGRLLLSTELDREGDAFVPGYELRGDEGIIVALP